MGVVYNKMSTSTLCTTTSTSSSLDSDVQEIQESHDEASESILDKLRTPRLSELSKVHANPPIGKKRSLAGGGQGRFDPQSIKPLQRVPGKHLVDSAGQLFCKVCRETIAVKRSVVQNHVKSEKHESSKEKLKVKMAREKDIAESLQKHDAITHRKGESLPKYIELKLLWHF